MYIYLYTENEYILDTLDIKYIQRTEPTFLFKTRYSDSPDKKRIKVFLPPKSWKLLSAAQNKTHEEWYIFSEYIDK